MSGELAFVEPEGPLYRLGRDPDPWAWPNSAYAGPDGTFGNRYDDPEASYRVLYASSQRVGAFVETLARFRPDLEVLAELEQIEGEDESPAGVPRACWTIAGSARPLSTGDSSTSATRARLARCERHSPRVRFATASTRSTRQRFGSARRGERVLRGESDRVDLLGVDRWIGGTHVTRENVWRWDPAGRRLVAPA